MKKLGRRRTSIIRNFLRQPTSGSSHRSRHEGLEARVGVWGDAAGTAPAVTSVRASAFDLFQNFLELFKSAFNARPTGAHSIFGPGYFHRAGYPHSANQSIQISKILDVIRKT